MATGRVTKTCKIYKDEDSHNTEHTFENVLEFVSLVVITSACAHAQILSDSPHTSSSSCKGGSLLHVDDILCEEGLLVT